MLVIHLAFIIKFEQNIFIPSQVTNDEVTALGESVIVRLLPVTDTRARLVVYRDVTPEQVQSAAKKLQYVIRELDSDH